MTFAKTFGQRHVLHFLDSHVDLLAAGSLRHLLSVCG